MAEIMATSHSTAADMASSCPGRKRGGPDAATLAARDPRRSRIGRDGRALKKWWAPLVAAVILLGCRQIPAEVEDVDAAGSAIRFEHADFQPELSQYAVQRYPRTGAEVHLATFNGPDSLAVLAVVKAGPGYVLQERSTESMVPDLMAEEMEIVWGARGGTMSGVGHTQYRLFEIVGQPLSCVGFAQPAGWSSDDRHRKPNAVFGYFCRDDSRPMTTESAEELLAQVKMTRGG
jgi:hypothetical protein